MNKKQLKKLSKNELIRIILKLQEDFDKVKRYLRAFDNPHTPSSKKLNKSKKSKDKTKKSEKDKNKDKKEKKPRFPGKPKGSNGGGIEFGASDEIIEHKLKEHPLTWEPLGEPTKIHIKRYYDLPDKPIKLYEHHTMVYELENGSKIHKIVDLPKGHYGKNLRTVVALLKNLTNSQDKIAEFIKPLGAPSFSSTTVQNISTEFTDILEPDRTDYLNQLREQPYIHADETTMGIDGNKGYIWTVCNKAISIFLAAKGRGKKYIVKLLRNYKGVLIVDGYGGYDWYPIKQRCWSHLIREFKDYAKDNSEIQVQYKRLKKLYEFLKIINKGPPDEKKIKKAKWILEDICTCLGTIKGARKLKTYIENGGDDWFTALYYQEVPLQNNHAERELRPVVLLRKSIGCYRNKKGKNWIDIVVSVLHTWKLQGLNLFQFLRPRAC